MTGLTQVAITARKTVRYIIFFIVFLMVGKVVLDLSVGIYKKLFPAPPPAPTVKYGRLPKIDFPVSSKVAPSFALETAEGGFPKVSDQAKVYFMPKINPNLLSLDVAKEKAKRLGFASEPEAVSDTVYKFQNPNGYPSHLEMNIVSGVFSISYDLASDRTPLDRKPPVTEVAASLMRSYLSQVNILPADLIGEVKHNFLKLSDGKLVTALSLSESDLIKINFTRKNYGDLPSVTADPDESNVWFIVSGSGDRNQQIIAGEYHYFPVDENQFSTYPIKAPETAFQELQGGAAFIADQGTVADGESLKIRRIYLAYFDPEGSAEFYQPVYVFEGDKDFTAYVPAVDPSYYGE